tara:strand:+ start:1301 stop:1882 length:582 start_codon:yes stop_codon:yes gene_type:complete
MIIGIAGKYGSGKGELASMITDNMKGDAVRLSFADPIKEIVRVLIGNKPKDYHIPEYNMTVAKLYQVIGTNMFRDMIHKDIWVDHLKKRWGELNGSQDNNTIRWWPNNFILIIDDLRFQNEVDWIRSNDGKIIYVESINIEREEESRKGRDNKHESENGIISLDPDFIIRNNGSLDELEEHAKWICEEIEGVV